MTSRTYSNLLDWTPQEVKNRLVELGFESYRADQVLQWVYEKGVYDFDWMTNLSAPLRAKLKESFSIVLPEIADREKSGDDKSVKLLLKLSDKEFVETVCMPTEASAPARSRSTVCVSSQVGCKFHCAFCASGQEGFFRNLTAGEMLAQALLARDACLPLGKAAPDRKITHIVFMGIGEPFDNYKELLKTVRTLNSPQGLHIGARKITISTCGIIPKIEALGEEGLQVELSVSLHGATDTVRGAIMPVNKAYPVSMLIEACRRYAKKTKRAITFEYILIKGVNASEKDARDLAKLLKGMLCKVNLIPYNPIEEFPHAQPLYPEIVAFQNILENAGIRTTVRFSKGRDIQAACGQLRSVKMKGK